MTRDEATQAHGPIQDMPDLDVEEPVEPDPDPSLPITELYPPQMRDRQVEIADLAADLINATRERQATKAVQAVARATDEFGLMAGMYGICVQLAEVVWVGSARPGWQTEQILGVKIVDESTGQVVSHDGPGVNQLMLWVALFIAAVGNRDAAECRKLLCRVYSPDDRSNINSALLCLAEIASAAVDQAR